MNEHRKNLLAAEHSVGEAFPLGATPTPDGCNFAVYAPDAKAVILCFFNKDTEEATVEHVLPEKTGDIWHGYFSGVRAGQFYGYRVERGEGGLHAANTHKLLIDPYAKKLSRPIKWDARQYKHDSQFMIPKCIVIDDETYAKPVITSPKVPKHKRIVYEAHVKGLTKLHPDVPKAHQGKFLGAAHPSVIKHLKALGITTVQFMPLCSFMPEPFITEKGLTNYWGYNPVNFFAPEPRYGVSDALAELQEMVAAYHRAGLEVIVDVVFNHTAEAGKGGPILSYKGFCPYQAYLLEQTKTGELVYSNHSGCGNTINTAQPFMMGLILDAMRHWVSVIGVDGFRFDLAVSLGREPQQYNKKSGLLRAISSDPVLKNKVLLAEPWDIGPGGYQVGNFPSPWLEVNDKYRDTVRAFWRGDDGVTADFATRLMGSRDIFHKGHRHISASVNNISYHDGFTLHDMVTYAERHNLDNLEENRDGHGHNLSANYGVEGETSNPDIITMRERQKRNLFATLIFSQGTPHVLGGDELSRTQKGNNNAYCQDNPISWFNWELNKRKQDFLRFCQYVIRLRQSSSLLSELKLHDDTYHLSRNVKEINWYKPDGSDKASEDWNALHNKAFGVEIKGCPSGTQKPEHWFLCVNASENDVRFHLPSVLPRGGWTMHLDTRYASLEEQPSICIQKVFLQASSSLTLFSFASFDA
ncbi:glycogen debranching protein GlgX [Alteromonas sp. McT4-15]|uniref:glycogen debranching protein GlgX n=1 Tax=Alteromonas sp. McT4-15 TaxID=2881256 RepID=UPI001CF8EDAE|nr:glycogen debranching protein GlgX [Alteromonas sp. McT4-15]MCB4435813.1 glycogen debranching protein GlgX [Alteromonas sp. McT4-15]